jgi:hypothetical protein
MAMRRDVVVFTGPTIGSAEARKYLDAIYMPPVGQGDLVRAVADHAPCAIVIIDGVFAQRPAVRHKEILWAMAAGISVYGSSSMGAIRAAELAEWGMVGHGLVFRWYRRTALADDADVAVPMAPPELGSVALGEALVDIRLTLKRAERENVIARDCRIFLDQAARSLHFTERSYGQLLSYLHLQPRYAPDAARVEAWLAMARVKQKKADAIGLLRLLASLPAGLSQPPVQPFEMTDAFRFDLECSGLKEEFVRSKVPNAGRDNLAKL